MDWEAFYSQFRQPDFIPGYEIQNRLGGGAFGEVYKARKHSIGKAYAIKFLKIDDDAQREAVERELEQVRHFAAIDHPNLVTIEDLGTAADVPYLIMGYAGEETLARALRSKTLPPQTALLYFVQACRGVLALHDRRLVHFDLKPSNIFLKGEIARVGDYGLSKMMTDGRLTLSFGRGTPQYMAPEMIKNRADHRADIYSLGVILYESVTGALPFESAVPGTLAVRESDEPPKFAPDFPPLLQPIVERCLRLDPKDRFASVSELLEALGQNARPGESVRFHPRPVAPGSAEAPTPRSDKASSHGDARQTAAELARGAVEVARGVWDGLRTASQNPRSTRGESPIWPAASTPVAPRAGPPPIPSPKPALAPHVERRTVAEQIAAEPDPDAFVMHSLSDGLVTRPVALATAHASHPMVESTIPVPPKVKGGWLGTLGATGLLGVEVLIALVRGIASRVRTALRPSTVRTHRSLFSTGVGFVKRALNLAGFVLIAAALGGLFAWLVSTWVQPA
jgi:serine/threonine protein kinase